MTDKVAGPDRSGLSEALGPSPEREAFARWMADTHAPALRRMDVDGAHAAGYAAGVAAERERWQRDQQAWEDTRTQRDQLLAHIAGKAPLPEWAADWLKA